MASINEQCWVKLPYCHFVLNFLWFRAVEPLPNIRLPSWWCFLLLKVTQVMIIFVKCNHTIVGLSIRNIHSIWIQWTHGWFLLLNQLQPMLLCCGESLTDWQRIHHFSSVMTDKQMELFQKFSNCSWLQNVWLAH